MKIATDVFEKARSHERLEQLQAAREQDLLPYFREVQGEPGPGGGDGGPRADHARLEQLPRPDHRRARQAGRTRRPGRLRHGPHRLALHERHDPAAPGARARAGRVDGHRARRWSTPPATRPTWARRHPAGTRGHRDLRLGRPRLDPGRRVDVAGPHPPLPPQPPRQARADALARRGRRRRRAGGGGRRVLDGGRLWRRCRTSWRCAASTAPA